MESDKMESESATKSLESIETSDFGVLLRSYRCRSPPIWLDFDSDVSDDEDFNKLLKNLRAVRRAQSSGFCVFWDYTYRSPPSRSDFSSSEKKHVVADDEDWVKSPDDQMATGSLESNDSGVSLKSDRSKGGGIDFKDRVSPRPDFSSSEEEDVSDDEDWVKSPDDLPEDDILPYIYPWSDDCDWMELADNLWWDFDSDVSVVEDFNRLQDNQARHEPGAVV